MDEQFERVNRKRRGEKYKDEDAAISELGSVQKKDLPCSPFIKEFEYGTNNEGYWCYEWMVIQFEDCVDCLTVLYPQYDYVFLFDHSCGHDKQREDGLNVQKMGKSYGGKQPAMRDTVISKKDGYLGPFQPKLQVGDTQVLLFCPQDSGPFWMTTEERERKRKDARKDGTRKVKRNKRELIKMLQERGITATGKAEDIKKLQKTMGYLPKLKSR